MDAHGTHFWEASKGANHDQANVYVEDQAYGPLTSGEQALYKGPIHQGSSMSANNQAQGSFTSGEGALYKGSTFQGTPMYTKS